MGKTSPTQRTLELLRDQGHTPWIVERFNAFSGRRTDLFHIIDILIVVPTGVVGIQSFGTAFSEHRKKLMEDEAWFTRHWLKGKGNELVMVGWRKVLAKKGGKLRIYKPRVAVITMTKKGKLKIKEMKSSWIRNRG